MTSDDARLLRRQVCSHGLSPPTLAVCCLLLLKNPSVWMFTPAHTSPFFTTAKPLAAAWTGALGLASSPVCTTCFSLGSPSPPAHVFSTMLRPNTRRLTFTCCPGSQQGFPLPAPPPWLQPSAADPRQEPHTTSGWASETDLPLQRLSVDGSLDVDSVQLITAIESSST